jgi:hypothetical protein
MNIAEKISWKPKWTVKRYANDADFAADKPSAVLDPTGRELPAVSEFEGNLLLNEGIAVVLDLACGLASPTAFNNASARIGVGDSNTAASASQTDLQASTNKTYKAQETSYPSRSSQTVTFRSVFGSSDANYSWQEFTVDNGSGEAKTLNRKVSDQGTKASGQTWTVDVAITLS